MDQDKPLQSESISIPRPELLKLKILLTIASILFLIGIFLPMLTLTKFYFAKNSFSVISGVVELLKDKQIILFVVVAGFSIVLPILKILVIFQLLNCADNKSQKLQYYLNLMHEYGRWAMLDVLVVAILIVTVKLGAIASIKVHIGLYVFGAAVALIMYITHRVSQLFKSCSVIQET